MANSFVMEGGVGVAYTDVECALRAHRSALRTDATIATPNGRRDPVRDRVSS